MLQRLLDLKVAVTAAGAELDVPIELSNSNAKQKHLGCKKSARPIRSNMQEGRRDQKL